MRLIRNIFLVLSLFIAFSGEAQILANHGLLGAGYVSPLSPSTYGVTTNYHGTGKNLWIYKPPGYNNNTSNYPLIVFMPGYGATDRTGGSFSNVNNSGEGLGYFLSQGDKPPGVLICIPQNETFNVDYSHTEWDAAVAYMVANYRVDQNKMYATGLSGGAIGCENIFETETNCAAIITVSGPQYNNTWSSHVSSGIGFWQHHGASDGTFGLTIGGTLYNAGGAAGSALDFTPPPRATYYFGSGHSSAVWDTQVYNRKERTDATGSAKFDFVRWFKKFSLDATEQATLFVTNAEYTLEIVDYRESLQLVNNLSAGATKTSLLARLAAIKSTVDKGGTRYVVSCNASGTSVSDATVNDWTSLFQAGQGIANLTDDAGGSSTLTLTVTNQFATSTREGNAGEFNASRQKYKGIKKEFNMTGLLVSHSVSNGRITISNVPTGKKADIILHSYHLSGDGDASAMSVESSISASVNSGSFFTQYSAYNNAYYLEFDNATETSGNITLDIKTVSTRDVILQGLEIVIHN